jgi:succinoglycan biosynthesis protein ExoV
MTRAERSRSELRDVVKHMLAAPSVLALRQARKAEPQLSADARLAERKDRFNAVLAGIRRDYF